MFSKAKIKILGFLKQGITPHKLALTMAFGICVGIIPLLGSTSILCAAIALSFRLNMPAIQVVNYLIYPVQLLLFIPFLKLGAMLFSEENFKLSLNQITQMLADHPWQTISDLFLINMYGLLLWLLITPFIYVIVYFLFKRLFIKTVERINKNSAIQPQR